MKHRQLELLRKRLLAEGFSSRYITRLCNELEDHFHSILEDENSHQPDGDDQRARQMANDRIGSMASVYSAVLGKPELQPFAKQFPGLCFFLVPAGFISIFSYAMILIAYFIAQSSESSMRALMVDYFDLLTAGVLGLVTAAFGYMAFRIRIGLVYAIFSTGILSICSVIQVNMVMCAASNGSYFFTEWGFMPLNFVGAWIGFAVVSICFLSTTPLSIFGLRRILPPFNRSNDRSVFGTSVCTRSSAARTLACISLTFLLAMAVFYGVVDRAQKTTAIHPVDKLIEPNNKPEVLMLARLASIRNVNFRKSCILDSNQSASLDLILQEYSVEVKAIQQSLTDQQAVVQNQTETNGASQALAKADAAIETVLNTGQKERLQQTAYHSLGCFAIFRKEVSAKIRLSNGQSAVLKDALLKKIRDSNRLVNAWRRASTADQPIIVKQLESVDAGFGDSVRSTLSPWQLDRLREIRGTDVL